MKNEQLTPAQALAAQAANAAEDAALIEALVRREPMAIDRLYARYRALMYATARQIVRDEWDTEEVIQDVVWTIHRKADSFRGESGLSTWIYRITQNAARMLLRKRKRIALPLQDEDLDVLVHQACDGAVWHLPEAQAQANVAMRNLLTATANLPAENRELFVAMDLRGEDKDEVATRMGMTISALKARLHRVRKQLRDATVAEGSYDGTTVAA